MRHLIPISLVTAALSFAADLPVKEVVLYKNGIGYFVRGGELGPGEQARLEFKAEEMNDVLKSLTIADSSGARISGLRYDSNEPADRKLGRFPFQILQQQPLSAVLDQLKGARVELKTGAETIAGTIVGAREIPASDEKHAARQEITVLTGGGELRILDLSGFSSIRFADAKLQSQLADYLGVLAAGHSSDKRRLTVNGDDKGARRVAVSYVVPAPVWKSSYRLVFGEGSGAPQLEGWAMVDNTSGEDWQGVRLALVSGRPVSFISNLYAPRYVQRQVGTLPEEDAAAPELYKGGVAAGVAGGVVGGAPPPPPSAAPYARQAMRDEARPLMSTAAVQATGVEAGELFEYRFSEPVTVRKDESTMVPFVSQKITARKLLVYSQAGGDHPRNAAELTNSTGKTLDGGPITVFDAGSYAGEALMETLKGGDRRLISYAVDLGTRITTRNAHRGTVVREVHLNRGLLTTRTAHRQTTTYEARNVDAKAKTIVLEHALRADYKLIDAAPVETTASAYRFELKLPPQATAALPVTEETVLEQTLGISGMTPESLLTYIQNKDLNDRARRQLERIAQQKRSISANDGEVSRTERQIAEVARDEERVRQNIASLGQVSGQQEQVQKYARQLEAMETQIATLRDRLSEVRKNKTSLEATLASLIEETEF